MTKRKYKLKQRAAKQQETREKIVDAAVALHEEIGPAATTISALAERAGVQRLTVYRHFASEQEICEACSSKWLSVHVPPDFTAISAARQGQLTEKGLKAIYEYYSTNQRMFSSLTRDLGKVPAIDQAMARFDGYLEAFAAFLLRDWAPRRSKRLQATIRHALRFSTWQSLSQEGLGAAVIVELVSSWIAAASS